MEMNDFIYDRDLEGFVIGGYGMHLPLKIFHQNVFKTGAPESHIF